MHVVLKPRPFAILVLALLVAAFLMPRGAPSARAQAEDWAIDSLDISYTVEPDGSVLASETIAVDFRNLPSRGILRELRARGDCPDPDESAPPIHECPGGHDRLWEYDILTVEYADGREVPWEANSEGQFLVLRIGDPDVFLTGEQTYHLEYRLTGALDAYADHDEFYWDAVAGWDTDVFTASVSVTLPPGADLRATCFQGGFGSGQPCEFSVADTVATYAAGGRIAPGEYMTIVAGWQSGLVEVAPPLTEDRVSIDDFFAFDWIEWLGMAFTAVLGFIGVGAAWWKRGRDRRYTTVHYLTQDTTEEIRPLFGCDDQVVVEYLPPDNLKPAQMGVIIDERADTLDVTATIIDLAVRGHLHITEIPKEGWFGSEDWELQRLERDRADLAPYERQLLDALFEGGRTEVRLSALKDKFADDLKRIKKSLYADARERDWFSGNPETVKALWAGIGVGVLVVGALATVAAGYFLGRALIGAPLVLAGVIMLILSPSMSRRTPTGSEALRRVRGFREYIVTAETHQQEFNEQQNIFARYLPYAIVFECVDRWAKAFEGIDRLESNARASIATWYTGATLLSLSNFSDSLGNISSNFSSTIASTPASSGGSGFSGSAGGGGGGGGGGRW